MAVRTAEHASKREGFPFGCRWVPLLAFLPLYFTSVPLVRTAVDSANSAFVRGLRCCAQLPLWIPWVLQLRRQVLIPTVRLLDSYHGLVAVYTLFPVSGPTFGSLCRT